VPTVFIAGDSTAARKAPEAYPETGWGERLAGFLAAGWTVDNRAVNGRSTKSFVDQGRWRELVAALEAGDAVFIQFGHNDQKIEDPERYADAAAAYPANLRRMAGEVLAAGARPVVLSPIRRRTFSADGGLLDSLGPWAAAARAVAAELGLPFLDLHSASADWLAGLGDLASRAFFLHVPAGAYPAYPEGKADDTHLCPAGAAAVARLVAASLAAEGRTADLVDPAALA
jgi:lysophospholipase L1-like esterase